MTQSSLFELVQIEATPAAPFPISLTSEISAALASDAVVAFSISGGKDSVASAHATNAYLDEIGHAGPRVLIHSDLGRAEWVDSLPQCEQLADRLKLELIVTRRPKGDMLDRWRQRLADNTKRYVDLSCVTVISPWATKSMRFCTSEMKIGPITRALSVRFPGREIVSVAGIRRAESPDRKNAPTCSPWKKPPRKVVGLNWHPIDEWPTPDVFRYIDLHQLPLHPGYRIYNSTRISCTACILQSEPDTIAAAKCPENVPYMRAIALMEIESTFSFKQSGWLGDIVPEILTMEELDQLQAAKERGRERAEIESRIPKHLLYEDGWPTHGFCQLDGCFKCRWDVHSVQSSVKRATPRALSRQREHRHSRIRQSPTLAVILRPATRTAPSH